MKTQFKNQILIFIVITALCNAAKAQDVIRQVSCYDSTLKLQSDSLKSLLFNQGFVVVKQATMTMESEFEMPVIVPLAEGTWYNIAFIGDMTSKLFEVRMFDFDEKQVVYQKHSALGMESNIIDYSSIPKFSEYYMIKPLQVNKQKKKNICGHIILFKKVK